MLVQTSKGLKVLNKLNNVKYKEISLNLALANVREMTNSINFNVERQKLWENIKNDNVIDETFPISIKTKVNGFTRKVLCSTGLYSIVKLIAKKILRK